DIIKVKRRPYFGDGTGSKEKTIGRTISQALRFSRGMLTFDRTSNIVFRYLLMTHCII
ncbi:unnamed protein product, partial [marine sediment metagenome]